MQIFKVNRQIYQEASVIFYSQNMFYFDRAVVTLPFLRDHGTRSLGNLRKFSILYPSTAPLGLTSELGPSFLEGDERMWEDLCCFLSLRLRKLAHLDLRVERSDRYTAHSYNDSEWQSLQTPSDFPFKRRNELATLSTEAKVTVSAATTKGFTERRRTDYEGKGRVLFAPLQSWLEDSIARIRDRSGLSAETPESERLETAERYWKKRRDSRRKQTWRLNDPGFESGRENEGSDPDDSIAETAFRRQRMN